MLQDRRRRAVYLVPDGDELEIANAAAEYLADAMSIERLHGAATSDMGADMRKGLAEMGWFALGMPEDAGGSGLSAIEHALFFREVGRQCGPVDVLAQCLAAMMVDEESLRRSIISGDAGVSLAVSDGAGLRIFGSADAIYALHASRDEMNLIRLDGMQAATRPSLDPATSMRVAVANLAVVATQFGDHIWRMGQLGTAAMLVGLAEAALDQIVEYAKVRETFGRKIGSWQAVRHPCADMAVRLEAARSQLWYAATAMKEGRADAGVHLDAAKHLGNLAAVANTDSNIQLHGGIGVTDEHHAHLFLKHALVLSKVFGAKRELLVRLLYAKVDD
jgi:alkylation response protein AidB-like acyl-CoA dehydrogenase